MKKIKLTESELKNIISNAIQESMVDENALIDRIGEEVQPIYQKLNRLKYIYGEYERNGGFLGSVVADLHEAVIRLEHLMYLVNH